MKSTNLTIKVDKELREKAGEIFKDIGLSTSAAVTIFLKAAVRERGIPFELKSDLFYSRENLRHIDKAVKDYESGAFKRHELIEE